MDVLGLITVHFAISLYFTTNEEIISNSVVVEFKITSIRNPTNIGIRRVFFIKNTVIYFLTSQGTKLMEKHV